MSRKSDVQKNQRIQVFARCRPINNTEKVKCSPSIVEVVPEKNKLVLKDGDSFREYLFDSVFPPDAEQSAVYKAVVEPLIHEVVLGYHCTVLVYGQTGTGKTYTMEGERKDADCTWENDSGVGIIPRAFHHLLEELNRAENVKFSMKVSFLEIYNEEVYDLLGTNFDKLRLYEDNSLKDFLKVNGLKEVVVNNKDELYAIFERGTAKRHTAETLLNAASSRSHTIFTISVLVTENTENGEQLERYGKLNLVDLAGSENVGRSGAVDKRDTEAGTINRSLLTLGRVITSLIEKQAHVPYRKSKLTRLLQFSLGGHAKTCMIATISPALCNYGETVSTLDYVAKAKAINIKPEINRRIIGGNLITICLDLCEENERLRKENKDLVKRARSSEGFDVDSDSRTNLLKVKLAALNKEYEKHKKDMILFEEKERLLKENKDFVKGARSSEGFYIDSDRNLEKEVAALNKEFEDLKVKHANDMMNNHESLQRLRGTLTNDHDSLINDLKSCQESIKKRYNDLKIMVPTLSTGAINRILNGEDVPTPVFQILDCKEVAGSIGGYSLLISDGITAYPLTTLGYQLGHMVTNGELEKFTIVQVDGCECHQVLADWKFISLLKLTVLVPGNEVNEKLGNPVTSRPGPDAVPIEPVAVNGNRVARGYQGHDDSISGDSAPPVLPVSSLTPYLNKWTIKVRVTSKSPLETYGRDFKFFTVNLLDESGEIKATGFNDVAGEYYDMLEPDKVYYISWADKFITYRKTDDSIFSHMNNYVIDFNSDDDFVIEFNKDTIISLCEEAATSIPMFKFEFVPIANIEEVEIGRSIDVIGICKTTSDLQTVASYTSNKEKMTTRRLKLVDRSNKEVYLTLWDEDAKTFDGSSNPVVAVKETIVDIDFSGKSLITSARIYINPDIKEAHILKGWFEREGCNMEYQSISSKGFGVNGGHWETFPQTVGKQLGSGDKPDYFIDMATVDMLRKDNCMYMACPGKGCNKKVVDMYNSIICRYKNCNREYPEIKWCLLLSLSVLCFMIMFYFKSQA